MHSNFVEQIRSIATDERWYRWQSEPQVARTLVSLLYNALSRAEENILLNQFEAYDEHYLDNITQKIGKELNNPPEHYWKICDNTSSLFESAVAALRFIDEQLSFNHDLVMKDTISDFITDDGYFVLPCRKVSGDKSKLTGQSFKRRGLLNHRIVPQSHNGVRFELHIHNDVSANSEALPVRRKVGAALFSRIKLAITQRHIGSPNFTVTDITCDTDTADLVLDHCRRAVNDECDTLVWPELTMPPTCAETARDSLQVNQLRGTMPPIAVLGSWHLEDGGIYRNRSTVTDGRGDIQFSFDKCLRFMSRPDGEAEDIEPGDTVHLLFSENELIAFFICLDFCHTQRIALLDACDPSMVIVPSMGDWSTMESHLRHAQILRTSHDTRTVVVQQYFSDSKSADEACAGYVLRGAASPSKLTKEDVATPETFISFYTDGKI